MLIDQVKAHFTLTTELVSIKKESQMLHLAGNILVQDLNFTTHVPRLVRNNFRFCFFLSIFKTLWLRDAVDNERACSACKQREGNP